EVYPSILIDLVEDVAVTHLDIENRKLDETRKARNLAVWVSRTREVPDRQRPDWTTKNVKPRWEARMLHPKPGRYVKIGLNTPVPTEFHLAKVKVFGRRSETAAATGGKPASIRLSGPPKVISTNATYTVSSRAYANKPPAPALLTLNGPLHEKEYGFITRKELYPFIIIDLDEVRTVSGIYLENRKNSTYYPRARTLSVWTSVQKIDDMPRGRPLWSAKEPQREWFFDLPPHKARYICIGLNTKVPETFHLAGVRIMGE
ncbi:MAG: hypothetical protein AAF492_15085, partial [Verrucomicrobiota bacterium]